MELYVSSITLSELLYVSSRIYRAAGAKNPNQKALDFVYWVRAKTDVIKADEDIALRAGELRKKLGIALPDCYVIASAEKIKAVPLFKEPEKEMKKVMSELRNLGVKFLNEVEL